jgi:hypothetical protein
VAVAIVVVVVDAEGRQAAEVEVLAGHRAEEDLAEEAQAILGADVEAVGGVASTVGVEASTEGAEVVAAGSTVDAEEEAAEASTAAAEAEAAEAAVARRS